MKGFVLIGHGPLPQAFMASVQMITGEMAQLHAVCLMPEEGVAQLTSKLDVLAKELEAYDEVLIFADLFGGTPANTVFQYFAEDQRVSIVSGMNFPMVLTALLSPDERIEGMIEAGREGMKELKNNRLLKPSLVEPKISQPTVAQGLPMVIKNVRVDARGIHGQVATAWVPHLKVNRIMVIDDLAVNDPTQKMALMMAKPNSVKLSIVSTKTAIARLNDPSAYQDEAVFILLTRIDTLRTLTESGFHFQEVNLGNVPSREKTTKYRHTIHLTSEEAAIIGQILTEGTRVTAQMVPNDAKVDFATVLAAKKS